jgi:hypothetical protein
MLIEFNLLQCTSFICSQQSFQLCRVSVLTKPVRPVCHTGQAGICVQKVIPTTQDSSIISFDLLFVPDGLCMCCILFSLGITTVMSGSPPTQYYERRKKSQHDVDAGEGSSRNPPPQRQSKRTVHRDFPRGRMHIDIEIEEVEEDRMEKVRMNLLMMRPTRCPQCQPKKQR